MPETITLFTPRLLLRKWDESDRAPFAAMNADPAVMAFFPALQSRAMSDASIDHWLDQFARQGWSNWALACGFERLGLTEIVSFTALENRRSRAVMERIGMHDTGQDFDHPALPEGHALRRHCLYRITRAAFDARL